VETTIAVHHVAPAALIALLLPVLRKGAVSSGRPSRVVNVSSTVERFGQRLTDWSYPGRGLIRGEALARYVREQTGGRRIEQMRMPLGIVATDLDSGEPILFQLGDPGVAVRASSAVPAMFQPVRIGTREYVDGGLVAPVPVHFARQMGADLVIAVDISAAPDGNATGDAMRMLLQTFAIMGRSINNFELRDADVLLRPKLSHVSGADFAARKRSLQAGRDAAQAQLALLRERIAAKTR